MNDQERIASLEVRVNQLETWVQELLIREGIHTRGTAGINPLAITPQERPENRAIQEALLAGDTMKAIKLYRQLYGCSLQEAAGALRITLNRGR